MFDIGWGEFVVIGVVALIAIGPKELPGVLRSVGQWTAKIKRMASDFQGQFNEAMREAEMADLKKHGDDLNAAAKSFTSFDPLADSPAAPPAMTTPVPAVEPPIDVGAPPEASTPETPAPSITPSQKSGA